MAVKRLPRLGLLAVTLCLLLAGCASGRPAPDASPGGGGSVAAPSPKRITAAIRGAANSMAQAKTQRLVGSVAGLDAVEELVHTGLTHRGVDGILAPRLAQATPSIENGLWQVAPDGLMRTSWTLRPDARWQDGSPLTTADLLFAIAVEQDAELALPRNPAYDLIESVETPDDRSVVVNWKRPYIEADAMFGHLVGLPLPRHLLERSFNEDKPNFFSLPYWTDAYVGAGAFRMREWVPDSHAVLQASDSFVLGRPKINEIEVRFMPDPNTVVANLLAGTVHLTLGRGPSFEQGMHLKENWQDGQVLFRPGGWIVITPQLMTPSPAIVGNLEFRRALLHAIDRQELVESLMAGQSSVGHAFISPDDPEYLVIEPTIVKYDYDSRRARGMLDDLGLTRGADGTLELAGQRLNVEISTTVQNDMHLKSMPATAEYWKQVGVAVDQVPIPLQRIQDREYRATFPAFTLGLMSVGLSPQDVMRYHSSATPLPENRFSVTGNTARYMNPEQDALLERYTTTVPKDERLRVLGQLLAHQTTNVTAMGLFHYVNPTMVAGRLQHVTGRSVGATESWNAHLWELK
jgi:peptide/nickel transport system substrate-binding protein